MELERWTTAQAAAYLRITPAAWRNYYSRAVPKHNPAPKPDGYYDSRTPWWWSTTVARWQASRTGTGHFPRTQGDEGSS